LVLSVCSLLVFVAVSPVEATAQVASCGNFQSFGTLELQPGEPLYYSLYSGGGSYEAVLDWGDGAQTHAPVGPEHTLASPLVINNTYEGFGTFNLTISTTGTTSDGAACSDFNVTLGQVNIPLPLNCNEISLFGDQQLEAGDTLQYELTAGSAPIPDATIEWGDRGTDPLPRGLPSGRAHTFSHTYNRAGTFDVYMTAPPCPRTKIGTVTVTSAPPTRTLPPRVAKEKCDDFLRGARGRIGSIIRRATQPPKTTCPSTRNGVRTCKTVVTIRRRCRCRYIITTRVPARGKVTVVRAVKRRLGGGAPSTRPPR
jgi:hypothetical protein